MGGLIEPVEEVALDSEEAAQVLTKHVDLTELCRGHQILGSLIWAVYDGVCGQNGQYMKNLLMGKSMTLAKAIRSVPSANLLFFEVGHPYGMDPRKANRAKH